MARLTWLGWIGVSALLVACGKREDNPAPISQEELPARVAAIRCEGLSSCCERSGFPFDVTTCKQRVTAAFEFMIGQFAANVDYDARAAGECLEALSASSSCGKFDEETAAAWERIFPGRIEQGQPCSSRQECRNVPGRSVNCSSEDGITPAVCTLFDDGAPSAHAQLGETCSGTCNEGVPCSSNVPLPATGACYRTDGLWCNFDTEPRTCSRLVQVGQVCTHLDSCAIGTFCAFDTRVCTAPRADGQPCLAHEDCQSGHCKVEDPPPGSDASEPIQSYCVAEEPVTAEECKRESE